MMRSSTGITDGKGKVKDYTVRELKSFKANQTHPEYANSVIPTLAEVYDLLKPTGLEINVELKTGIYFYPDIEKKLLKLAREKGMEEKLWYSSFNHYSLIRMKELEPSVRTGILYADGIVNVWDYAKKTVGRRCTASALLQYPVSGISGKDQSSWAENTCLDGQRRGRHESTYKSRDRGDHHQLSGQSKKNHSGNRRNRKCMMY